ncbi:hypothetical protein [Burkholderia sp. GS2Y]|uniref:Uncharacterized protein n=1 Tax=Burkholderia theae TaxID=3143496 RepID=A0ABU9WBB4_9BURK
MNEVNRERYLVKSAGDNIEGTRTGLVKFLELLAQYDDAVIVVPSISQYKGNLFDTLLQEYAPALAKALFRDRTVVLDGNKRVHLCSSETLKNFSRSELYLVLWGSRYTIADVEALHGWGGVVLVSWQSGDYAAWVRDHSVQVVYDDGVPDIKI